MPNITNCSDLYYTDMSGAKHTLQRLYYESVLVWEKQADRWQFTINVKANTEVSISMSLLLTDNINWGDGCSTNGYQSSHTYINSGTYNISIQDSKKANLNYTSIISPSNAVIRIFHPSYATKISISNCENLIDINYKLPTSITKLESVSYCNSLHILNIPNGVISIESIQYMSNLQTIHFPTSIVDISKMAFRNDIKLDNVILPNLITSVKDGTFLNCYSLKNISLGGNVTSLESECFRDCDLRDISLPDKITKIPTRAFYGNANIVSIKFPNDLLQIGDSAFNFASSKITDENYSNTTLKYLNLPSKLQIIEQYAFTGNYGGYYAITSLVIPNSVQVIQDGAFKNMKKLEYLTVGTAIQAILNEAFLGTDNLKSVTINGNIQYIGYNALGYSYDETRNAVPIDEFIIYGVTGSYAEVYANQNGFTFIPI